MATASSPITGLQEKAGRYQSRCSRAFMGLALSGIGVRVPAGSLFQSSIMSTSTTTTNEAEEAAIQQRYRDLENNGDLPEINAASLHGALHLNYSYDEQVSPDATDTINRKGRSPIHADLRKAFYALGPHLAVACEELDWRTIPEMDIARYTGVPEYDEDGERTYQDATERILAAFEVSALRCEGAGEKEGVVLIGTKTLSTKDTVKLESPRIIWVENYHFLHDLRMAVDTLLEEVQLYKLGKQAPAVQQGELFDDDEGGDQE